MMNSTETLPVKWVMKELGLLSSDHARPVAPLSEATRARVGALLAGSPHLDFPVRVRP